MQLQHINAITGYFIIYLVVTTSSEFNAWPPSELESAFTFIIDGLIQMVLSGSCNKEMIFTDFKNWVETKSEKKYVVKGNMFSNSENDFH